MSTTVKLTFETGDRSADEVEREVKATVEAATGETPDTYQYAGNVVWWPSGVPEIEHVHDVDVPRAVRTRFNDTVDAGDGTLFERVDGTFVAVDSISSPSRDYGNYVLDYFRINYGIAPWYRYSKPEQPGTSTRPAGRDDWLSVLSPETFTIPDFESETAAIQALTADDRSVRDQAIRYFAYEGIDDLARYEKFLAALPTVDEQTRAVVASELWVPAPLSQGATIDASLITSLLSLVDDPVPEVRLGAFMGAARAIGALYERIESGDTEVEGDLDDVVKPFYEAYADLLNDTDPRIRERTVNCLSETLGNEGYHLFQDAFWLRIDFPLRWRIACAAEENIYDETLEALDQRNGITTTAFRGEQLAVPTLVEYAYDEQGPSHSAVRSTLADFARDEPAAALDALDPALEAVRTGDELTADVRLLAALAEERPRCVSTVADDLAAMLDNPSAEEDEDAEKKRRAAAIALNKLSTDACPVDHSTLAAVTSGITKEEYGDRVLDPDRVAALVEVDPDTAVDRLRNLPEEMQDDREDDGFRRSRVEDAVYETSKIDLKVIARAFPDLVALFDDPHDVSEDLAIAIARTANEHPAVVSEQIDAIATCLGHHESLVREATATAVVAIARERPEASSNPYAPLLKRDGDALDVETLEMLRERNDRSPETPADWPAGTLTSDPSMLIETVTACLDEDFYQHEQLADLIREVRASDPNAAEQLLEALLDHHRTAILPSSYQTGVITLLAETDPGLLAGVAESIVGVLADPDFETREYPDREDSRASSGARSLESGLLSVAQADPATAEAAVEAQYSSIEAFLEDHETDRRREIVTHIGDGAVTSRISGSESTSVTEDKIVDPFLSFEPGEYGADLVIDKDDLSEEVENEEIELVRCRVTENGRLRRINDDAFVRRIFGAEEPIGTVPDDPETEESVVSLVMHSKVPDAFVRLANPEDDNVLTKVMNLDLDVNKYQLFTQLCRSLGDEYAREDIEAIERRIDQLHAIEDVDGATELVQKQFF